MYTVQLLSAQTFSWFPILIDLISYRLSFWYLKPSTIWTQTTFQVFSSTIFHPNTQFQQTNCFPFVKVLNCTAFSYKGYISIWNSLALLTPFQKFPLIFKNSAQTPPPCSTLLLPNHTNEFYTSKYLITCRLSCIRTEIFFFLSSPCEI